MSALIPSGNATGTGTMTLLAPPTNGTQTVTIPDATGTMMVSGNMPAFSAYNNASQSITSATWTKVQFQVKEFDTNSNFDNATNYRFTPTVAGYYMVTAALDMYAGGTLLTNTLIAIYKNGSGAKRGYGASISATEVYIPVAALIYLNGTTDYVECYVNATSVGSITVANGGGASSYFQASLARAA